MKNTICRCLFSYTASTLVRFSGRADQCLLVSVG